MKKLKINRTFNRNIRKVEEYDFNIAHYKFRVEKSKSPLEPWNWYVIWPSGFKDGFDTFKQCIQYVDHITRN